MESNKSLQRVALIAAIISGFITPFMVSSTNIVLPAMARDFELNAVETGWVVTSYILSSAIFLVPFGRLSDIVGRKKIFTIGIFLFSIFTLAIASIPTNSSILLTLRFLQGMGSAMIFGTGMTIIISVFPPEERGKVLGINVSSVYLGLAIGPFAGGILSQHFTWRSIFFITAILSFMLTVFVFSKINGEWADAKGEDFDFIGSILYGISLLALMRGFSMIPNLFGFFLIVTGIILFVAFALYELRQTHPVLNFKIFRDNLTYSLATTSALINYSATFGVSFLLSLYLQTVKAMSPLQAGTIMLIQPIFQTILSPFTGRLADKREPQSIASFGMALTAFGLFLFIFLNRDTSIAFIIATLALLGTGFAFFSSPNTTAAMNSVEKKYYGVASSFLGTMRLLGQMFSMAIAMTVFSLIMHQKKISPEYSDLFLKSSKTIFIIFAILCFFGVFLKTGKYKNNAKK